MSYIEIPSEAEIAGFTPEWQAYYRKLKLEREVIERQEEIRLELGRESDKALMPPPLGDDSEYWARLACKDAREARACRWFRASKLCLIAGLIGFTSAGLSQLAAANSSNIQEKQMYSTNSERFFYSGVGGIAGAAILFSCGMTKINNYLTKKDGDFTLG